jgi:hypothetical protein
MHPSALLMCAAAVALIGCQQIAGIEKRTFNEDRLDAGEDAAPDAQSEAGEDASEDADASDADTDAEIRHPSDEQCQELCDITSSACTVDAGHTAFAQDSYCPAVCPFFVLAADPKQKTGNTFECRLDQAQKAKAVGPDDNLEHCQRIGTGGADVCGSNCEGYCQLYAEICGEPAPNPDCLEYCPKLRDDPSFDAKSAFGGQVDTLQCRLAHLAAAAIAPETHCAHAALFTPAGLPCNPEVPNCVDYCGMLMRTCTDDRAQYEALEDCMQTCQNGFTVGKAPDTSGDTLACRRYHTYNAVVAPESHCAHAGPGGDGHCGTICPAYCKLAKAACTTAFGNKYADDAACEADCATFAAKAMDLDYTVAEGKQGGNSIQCRLYHATKAFSDAAECAATLGGGACQ